MEEGSVPLSVPDLTSGGFPGQAREFPGLCALWEAAGDVLCA